jgi:hypothetical protein
MTTPAGMPLLRIAAANSRPNKRTGRSSERTTELIALPAVAFAKFQSPRGAHLISAPGTVKLRTRSRNRSAGESGIGDDHGAIRNAIYLASDGRGLELALNACVGDRYHIRVAERPKGLMIGLRRHLLRSDGPELLN